MPRPLYLLLAITIALAASADNAVSSARGVPRPSLAVAANVDRSGSLQAFRIRRPWDQRGEPLEIGAESIIRRAPGVLMLVSRAAGTLTLVDARGWGMLRAYDLGAGSEPTDVALLDASRALISRANARRLLLLDLRSGAAREATDLSRLADPDGVPDMGTMERFGDRLFVQLRRIDMKSGEPARPLLAVVDLRTGGLVDADPVEPGVQGVRLEGTAPRFKMQLFPAHGLLFVSATGGFFDAGGLEVIDLRTLRSRGLAVREDSGRVGADLGAFVMITPRRGYLTYSTDLLLSSHLHQFQLTRDGFELGPELHVSLDYFVPAMTYHHRSDTLFVPDGTFGRVGVHAFRGANGTRLTESPISTPSGPTTDLALFR